MPKLVTETIGTGDQSWLGESGPHKARSQALLVSGFTAATDYPNGYIPSGFPVGVVTASGEYAPYDAAATDGTQGLAGFVYTDSKVSTGDTYVNVALIDRGRININKLPVDFTPPADPGNFVFLTQS
jgi:hypothetical protein